MKNPGLKNAPEYDFMTFMTKEIPIIRGEKFSAEVKYLGGDLIKFQDYAVKKAFAVFITCNEEWELTNISKTVENNLLDNSEGAKIEGVVCSGRVESEASGKISLD